MIHLFIIATTSSSFKLSLTGISLILIPITTASAGALSVADKVIFEIIINKHNKNKKQYEKDQRTIETFDKLYRKSLQYNIYSIKLNMKVCITFLLNLLMKQKMNLFYKYDYKSIS